MTDDAPSQKRDYALELRGSFKHLKEGVAIVADWIAGHRVHPPVSSLERLRKRSTENRQSGKHTPQFPILDLSSLLEPTISLVELSEIVAERVVRLSQLWTAAGLPAPYSRSDAPLADKVARHWVVLASRIDAPLADRVARPWEVIPLEKAHAGTPVELAVRTFAASMLQDVREEPGELHDALQAMVALESELKFQPGASGWNVRPRMLSRPSNHPTWSRVSDNRILLSSDSDELHLAGKEAELFGLVAEAGPQGVKFKDIAGSQSVSAETVYRRSKRIYSQLPPSIRGYWVHSTKSAAWVAEPQ